jgi:pimeloyl-ACP methyl ester carboxylesterase
VKRSVVPLPQLGKNLAEPQLSFAAADLRIQAADIEFTRRELSKLDFVDGNKVALLGHSSGAVVAAMLAAQNRGIRALVSLDGSIATPDGVRLLREAAIDPRGITASLLNLHKMTPRTSLDAAFINALGNARVLSIGFRPATHFDFQNWPVYSLVATEEDERSKSLRPAASGRAVFWTVCERTRLFLEATLRGEKRAWQELRASPTRLPAEDVLVSEGIWKLP